MSGFWARAVVMFAAGAMSCAALSLRLNPTRSGALERRDPLQLQEINVANPLCADCGGWDVEWMRRCHKHNGIEFCRGCECPHCAEEALDEYEDDGPLDLEDQLERALDRRFPPTVTGK